MALILAAYYYSLFSLNWGGRSEGDLRPRRRGRQQTPLVRLSVRAQTCAFDVTAAAAAVFEAIGAHDRFWVAY